MSPAFYTGDQYLLLYLFRYIRGNAHPRGIMLSAQCCVYGSCCHVYIVACVIADTASGTPFSTQEGMSSRVKSVLLSVKLSTTLPCMLDVNLHVCLVFGYIMSICVYLYYISFRTF